MVTVEDEIERKTIDWLTRLESRYHAGLIDEACFRVGVETVWATMGGVIDTPGFAEIVAEANAMVAGLPASTQTAIHFNGPKCFVAHRDREDLTIWKVEIVGHHHNKYLTEDQSAAAMKRVTRL